MSVKKKVFYIASELFYRVKENSPFRVFCGKGKVVTKFGLNGFVYLIFAASLTYFPQPKSGGDVTAKE